MLHAAKSNAWRGSCIVLLGMFWVLAEHNIAFSQATSVPFLKTWVANGPVWAVESTADDLYIGGNFTYVGPETGNAVCINGTTGFRDGLFPNVLGTVYACIPDGAGGWFIGGDFQWVSGQPCNRLAHITSTGTFDRNWNPDVNGTVYSLVLSADSSTLFVGGKFTKIDSVTRNYLGAVERIDGQVTSWNPDADNHVRTMVLSADGKVLFVGGSFQAFNDIERSNIAAFYADPFDARYGELTPWAPGANGRVEVLYLAPTATSGATEGEPVVPEEAYTLYAGGWFSVIGGVNRNFIAALGADSGETLAWNPFANNPVYALVADDKAVYVGGSFTLVGAYSFKYLAAVDRLTGMAIETWKPGESNGIDGWITALALSEDRRTLYVGGRFSLIDGVDRARLAAINIDQGSGNYGKATDWDPGAGNVSYAITPWRLMTDEMVNVCGELTTVNGKVRHRLAAFDIDDPLSPNYQTARLNEWNPHADNAVYALAVSQTDQVVYAGGVFNNIGFDGDIRIYDLNRSRIAAIESDRSNPALYGKIRTDWNPGADNIVYSLTLSTTPPWSSQILYVGGTFVTLGGTARAHLGAVNSDLLQYANYGAVTPWNPGWSTNPNDIVWSLDLSADNGIVFAGGVINSINGRARGISALTANDFWLLDADYHVLEVEYAVDPALYIGGHFTTIGGLNRNRIARLSDPTIGDVDPLWDPSFNGSISALMSHAAHQPLFVGGNFTEIIHGAPGLTFPRERFASLDTNDPFAAQYGEPLPWLASANNPVYDFEIDTFGADFYAGGAFTGIGFDHQYYRSRSHLARFSLNDAIAPTITLLGANPLQVQCGSNFNDPGATAYDDWDGDLTNFIIVDTSALNMGGIGTYVVNYRVSDSAGNISQAQRTVVVSDSLPPVINLNGAGSVTLECGIDVFLDPGAVANDLCDGDFPAIASGTVLPGVPGTYYVNYDATDASGNSASTIARTVRVVDSLAPVFSPATLTPLFVNIGGPFNDILPVADDACRGIVMVYSNGSTVVNVNQTGTYVVTYTAGDGVQSASINRTVNVVDPNIPFVTGISALTPSSIAVSFSKSMGTNALTAAYYTLTGPGRGTLPPQPNQVVFDAPDVCRLIWLIPAEMLEGAQIIVHVSNQVEDDSGNMLGEPSSASANGKGNKPVLALNGNDPEVIECGSTYNDPGATAVDVPDGTLTVVAEGIDAVNTSVPGNYVITYRATDAAGNVGVMTRTVSVRDTTPPNITILGNANLVVPCGLPYTDSGATALDTCEGDRTSAITVNYFDDIGTEIPSIDTNVPGNYRVVYKVDDTAGNSAPPAQRNLQVTDTDPPVLFLLGSSPYVTNCRTPYVDPGILALDNCQGDVSSDVIILGVDAINAGGSGIYQVTYEVTDDAGNAAVPISRQVQVVDTIPPEIVLTGNDPLVVDCGSVLADPGAVLTDLCDGIIVGAAIQADTSSVNMSVVGNYSITYTSTSTDSAGLLPAPKTRVVRVEDLSPPVLTLGTFTPAPTIVDGFYLHNCRLPYMEPVDFIATDTCDGPLGPIQISVPVGQPGVTAFAWKLDPAKRPVINAGVPEIYPYDVFVNLPGDYLLCYVAFDRGGNTYPVLDGNGLPPVVYPDYLESDLITLKIDFARLVRVEDSLPPVINLNAIDPMTVECNTFFTDPVTAFDLCDGDLTASVNTVGIVNTSIPGNYVLNYTVTDSSLNTQGPVTRNVKVVDTTPPLVNLNASDPFVIECNGLFVDPATAFDSCDGDLTATLAPTGFLDLTKPGFYSLNYVVADAAGNLSLPVVRNIQVIDTVIPVISLNAIDPLIVECKTVFMDPVTAFDSCDGDLSASIVPTGTVNTNLPGFYTVTYTVSDTSGNAAIPVVRNVEVKDTQAPVIQLNGSPILIVECGSPLVDPVTAFDSCDGDLTASVVTVPPVNVAIVGTYPVTYTVSDSSGNIALPQGRTVQVVDTVPPVIQLNHTDPYLLECGQPFIDPATAFDTCDGNITALIVRTGVLDINTPGVYQLRYNVTDGALNPALEVIRNVVIQDTKPPVVTIGVNFQPPAAFNGTFIKWLPGLPFIEPLDFSILDQCQGVIQPITSQLPPVTPGRVIAYAWALDSVTKRPLWITQPTLPDWYTYNEFVNFEGYYLLIYETEDSIGNRYPVPGVGGYPPIFDPVYEPIFLDGLFNLLPGLDFARLVNVTSVKMGNLPLDMAKSLLANFSGYDVNADAILSPSEQLSAFQLLSTEYSEVQWNTFTYMAEAWADGEGMITAAGLDAFIQQHTQGCSPDTQKPVLLTRDISIKLSLSGTASIFEASEIYTTKAITYLFDNCDGAFDINSDDITISAQPDTFTCNDIGPNEVVVRAEDHAGNAAEDTITVTISDRYNVCESPSEGESSVEGEEPEEGEGSDEGEVPSEGENQQEGEPDVEGESQPEGEGQREGEMLSEGEIGSEGESENEGEHFLEGENRTEGEISSEGEQETEGESGDDDDNRVRCGCSCSSNKDASTEVRDLLGDWLLLGLTLLTLALLASYRKTH